MLDTVNRINTFQNILDGVVDGIFSCFNGKPFVSHVLQCDHFLTHLFLCQLFPRYVLILQMVRAVQTTVDAVIGQIQGRKHYNAVPVKCQLDLLRDPVHLLHLLRDLTFQKHRCLSVRQPLTDSSRRRLLGTCFLQNTVDQFHIVFVLFCVLQRCQNLFMADKFFCF